MAKKKRKPAGKRPKPARRPKSRPQDVPAIPDRRALEGSMHQMIKQMSGGESDSPLDRAQEIMYQAFEARDIDRRVALAREALAVSPDCADAYNLLAEHAKTRKESLELYRKAVEAGERAIGPEAFAENAGQFWLVLETRPYMRAKNGLANALWTAGRRQEAAEHLQDMIRLNPNDNQGVRYVLAAFLLNLDRDDDLGRLIEQYAEDSTATWFYTKALLAFRREGDTPRARAALKYARRVNKHVPDYLLGRANLPSEQPDHYGMGDRNEAILYAGGSIAAWKATPGAIAWLKKEDGASKKRRGPKPLGPTPLIKERLRRLPQEFDVWQAGQRQLASLMESDGERIRPWAFLVTSSSEGRILANLIAEAPVAPEQAWDKLVEAMEKPMAGRPHRPSSLRLRSDELRPHLEEIGVEVEVSEELDHVDFVFGALEEEMLGDEPPGLLEMPGVAPGLVAGFYQASAEFYRRAPWRSLGYEAAIKIECEKFQSGPWYGVVMGQSGLTFGIALYDDVDLLKRLWAGEVRDEDNARETVALSLTFGDETEIPFADLEAGRRLGWELAGPSAYPSLFRKERGMSMRPPLAWEIELAEATLRAVPDFVATHPQDDPSTHEATVPAAGGELTLRLSWVGE